MLVLVAAFTMASLGQAVTTTPANAMAVISAHVKCSDMKAGRFVRYVYGTGKGSTRSDAKARAIRAAESKLARGHYLGTCRVQSYSGGGGTG